MLPQALALLALGALCRAAPLTAAPRPAQDLCSSASSVESVIREVLEDVKSLTVQGSTVIPVNVTVKKCIRNHLRTFLDSLTALNGATAEKLAKVYACDQLFPQGSDEECKTAEIVNENVFREKIDKFLSFLYEEL